MQVCVVIFRNKMGCASKIVSYTAFPIRNHAVNFPVQKSIIIKIMNLVLQLRQISHSCVRLNNESHPLAALLQAKSVQMKSRYH